MNKMEFWEFMIDKFAEYMKEQGYSGEYVKVVRKNLRKLLREFGDLSDIDENAIWQKYMNKSKYTRKNMQQALRNFKKWCKGEF